MNNYDKNNYDKEFAIAKTGLTVSLLIFMLFIAFVFGRINTLQHKQIKNELNKIKNDVEYVKGQQEYNYQLLSEMNEVEEIGEAASREPGE